MFRKILIALVALVTIGAAAAGTTSAQARGGRGGGRGWGRGWGYRGWGYRGGYYPAYGVYGGCWRTVRVATPYGWAWRRVWVCG